MEMVRNYLYDFENLMQCSFELLMSVYEKLKSNN